MHGKRWNLVSVLILFAGAIWIWTSSAPAASSSEEIEAPRVGFRAPDFSLPLADGSANVTLSELRGQPVLINFWATWCSPCRAEMPAIQKMYDEYQGRGFIVLGINSASGDAREDILAFIQEYQLSFPILVDGNDQVFQQYQVRGLPTSIFVDADGKIQDIVVGGPMSEALLRAEAERLLNEAQ